MLGLMGGGKLVVLHCQLLQGGWTREDKNYWDGFMACPTSGMKKPGTKKCEHADSHPLPSARLLSQPTLILFFGPIDGVIVQTKKQVKNFCSSHYASTANGVSKRGDDGNHAECEGERYGYTQKQS